MNVLVLQNDSGKFQTLALFLLVLDGVGRTGARKDCALFLFVSCPWEKNAICNLGKLFCRTGNACLAPDNEEWLSRKPFNEHMFPILIRDVSTPDRKNPETFPKMENRDSISIFTSKVKKPLESIIYRKGFLWVFSEASLGIPGKW